MQEIIDDIDRDEYPYKLEFRSGWQKGAVVGLAAIDAVYWIQLIASIAIKIYFLLAK